MITLFPLPFTIFQLTNLLLELLYPVVWVYESFDSLFPGKGSQGLSSFSVNLPIFSFVSYLHGLCATVDVWYALMYCLVWKCLLMHVRTMAIFVVFAQADWSRLGENIITLLWILPRTLAQAESFRFEQGVISLRREGLA